MRNISNPSGLKSRNTQPLEDTLDYQIAMKALEEARSDPNGFVTLDEVKRELEEDIREAKENGTYFAELMASRPKSWSLTPDRKSAARRLTWARPFAKYREFIRTRWAKPRQQESSTTRVDEKSKNP